MNKYKLHRFQLIIHFFCLGLFSSKAQKLNYVHYDTKDGLAGTTVYDVCQDKDGFLWFATEYGLSRFDGTKFKNYTVKDGLPDNEVLKVFADSRGRIWIGTFSKKLSYYYQGKIFASHNDTLLSKIKLQNSVISVSESIDGSIMISDQAKLVEITKENEVRSISDSRHFRNLPVTGAFPNLFNGGFFIIFNDSVFKQAKDSLVYFYSPPKKYNSTYLEANLSDNGERLKLTAPEAIISTTSKNYSVYYISTVNGSWAVDTNSFQFGQHFLEGKKVSRTFEDSEKNLWFTTLGEGVFKLGSKGIKTIIFNDSKDIYDTEVFCMSGYSGYLICGLGSSRAAWVNKHKISLTPNNKRLKQFSKIKFHNNRLYCNAVLSSGVIILGFDQFLLKYENNIRTMKDIFPIKSIAEISQEYILVGTSLYAFKIRVSDMSIVDTIWKERCTKVFYHNSFYYIGTLRGLFKVKADRTYEYLGSRHPSLQRRINDIKESENGVLWIATNDEGVTGFKENSVITNISEKDGLSSSICKTIFIDNNNLWVGTNKGISKINLNMPTKSITNFSSTDGLQSDIINSIYVEEERIWVGSPSGLTYFKESDISDISICNLRLLGVEVSRQPQVLSNTYQLPFRRNTISFEYAGISAKSGGDISYNYRLLGLDTNWRETMETSLDFQSLQAGRYQLEIFAVNKFNRKSNTIIISIFIRKPFWRTLWFFAIILTALSLITIFVFHKRNKQFQNKLMEKNRVEQEFAILEQRALQSQMNPHFIFNCLNSIQQFIVIDDKESANKYLTGFASLVRLTLENSIKKTIRISDEIIYLAQYLELEKLRFADTFSYNIFVDPLIKTDYTEIPALILQPFVENSLRHGIWHLKSRKGDIRITFESGKNIIKCAITDNGIGREKAAELKKSQRAEYQSRGVSLTTQRIRLLNLERQDRIRVYFIDLFDQCGNSSGTQVNLEIPI